MTVIRTPSGTHTPAIVERFTTSQTTGATVHELIGGGVDVTWDASRGRTLRIRALCATQDAADALRRACSAPGAYALTDPILAFVPTAVTIEPDDTLHDGRWVVIDATEMPS